MAKENDPPSKFAGTVFEGIEPGDIQPRPVIRTFVGAGITGTVFEGLELDDLKQRPVMRVDENAQDPVKDARSAFFNGQTEFTPPTADEAAGNLAENGQGTGPRQERSAAMMNTLTAPPPKKPGGPGM